MPTRSSSDLGIEAASPESTARAAASAVGGVRLAPSMPGLAVGAVDLDDGAAGAAQVPGQASPIGAGPLDAEPRRGVTEGLGPAQQPSVASGRRGDLEVPQGATQVTGEGRSNVDLAVGVDADGDTAGRVVCDAGRSHPHVLNTPALRGLTGVGESVGRADRTETSLQGTLL